MELKEGLYIVATPIGNLEDITLRALFLLQNSDIIYCEDTRTTHKLLQKHKILDKKLAVYNDHSDKVIREKIADLIKENKVVSLVCDAGTPLISDPGYKLVRYLQEQNLNVDIVPGACAAIAALVLSGLPTDQFYFAGFMPKTEYAKKQLLSSLENIAATIILYESPARVMSSLKVIEEILGNREVAVIREITKIFQTTIRKPVSELLNQFELIKTKGEFVLLINPKKPDVEITKDELKKLVHLLKKTGKSTKDIAEELKVKWGKKLSKNDIYKL